MFAIYFTKCTYSYCYCMPLENPCDMSYDCYDIVYFRFFVCIYQELLLNILSA